MKILLLGANGQVGFELLHALAPLGELTVATRDGTLTNGSPCMAVDLGDEVSLARSLDGARADLIVNAAAYTAVDRAEDEPELADRINHRALGEIGAWAAAHGAHVVHYSTDYVFDGGARRPYREDDPTAPLGVYGRSKLAGEQALAASGASHLIFRTAWVYASHGHNFLRTMLRLAAERDELRVVADQVGAPTPARWIARTTAAVLAQWDGDTTRGDADAGGIRRFAGTGAGTGGIRCFAGSGGTRRFAGSAGTPRYAAAAPTDSVSEPVAGDHVFNLVAGGHCSWFDFASAIIAGAAARSLIARAPRVVPIATADFPTRAQRPAWSVLDCAKLENAFGLQLADWRAGLDEVLDDLARR